MRITYLIGNGFDIASDLPTSANTVVSEYRKEVDKSLKVVNETESGDVVNALEAVHQSLCEDFDAWSDFEMAIAGPLAIKCCKRDNPADTFKYAFIHFNTFLYNYINQICTTIEEYTPSIDQQAQFYKGVFSLLSDGLRPRQRKVLSNYIEQVKKQTWTVDFISFNYTHLLDKLILSTNVNQNIPKREFIGNVQFGREILEPLHIHGSIEDGHGIIVGPDHPAQIECPQIANDISIRRMCVKPLCNDAKDDLAPEQAISLIKRSSVIVVFGMSLGESDETWWKELGGWLSQNSSGKLLIIHNIAPITDLNPEAYFSRKEELLLKFFDRSHIADEDVRERLSERILISENSRAFKLGISFRKKDG